MPVKPIPLSVPLHAMLLLDFIGGKEAPSGYETIFGNRQSRLPVPITRMTYGDLVEAQANWGNKGWVKANWGFSTASSAAGRFQFMRATLIGIAKDDPSLRGDAIFDRDLQDRLGYHLLLRRGYDDFLAGRIDVVQFGKALAQEWASFPVLADCKGAHRSVVRGQSFYVGDGLNKALVSPDRVEAVLGEVLVAARVNQTRPVIVGSEIAAPSTSRWAALTSLLARIFGGRK